jgi:hypothetical protein
LQQEAEEEDDDDVQQAKALDRVKEMEDRMVLEAALEEEFGDEKKSSTEGDADASRLAVWDWLTDFADADAAVDGLEEARSVGCPATAKSCKAFATCSTCCTHAQLQQASANVCCSFCRPLASALTLH